MDRPNTVGRRHGDCGHRRAQMQSRRRTLASIAAKWAAVMEFMAWLRTRMSIWCRLCFFSSTDFRWYRSFLCATAHHTHRPQKQARSVLGAHRESVSELSMRRVGCAANACTAWETQERPKKSRMRCGGI